MNMPTTTSLNTFTAREAYIALKDARHPDISIGEEWIEMMDDLYTLGLKGHTYSKDELEGVRTAVVGDSQIRTLLEKKEGGCSVVAVRNVQKAVDEHARLKKFSSRLIQSDIGRPLIPRTEDQIYGHVTVGELQANLRLVGRSSRRLMIGVSGGAI